MQVVSGRTKAEKRTPVEAFAFPDRRQSDPELEKRIEAMAEKIRNYEAPVRKPEPPKDLVQLKKKQVDGSTVPVGV